MKWAEQFIDLTGRSHTNTHTLTSSFASSLSPTTLTSHSAAAVYNEMLLPARKGSGRELRRKGTTPRAEAAAEAAESASRKREAEVATSDG